MPLSGAGGSFFGVIGLLLGTRGSTAWEISPRKAVEYLDRVGEFKRGSLHRVPPALPDPTGLQIAGADPFAQLDDLESLLTCASQNNMLAEVVTRGDWDDSDSSIEQTLHRFREKLHLITVSTRHTELSRYGIGKLDALLQAIRRAGISFCVRCGVGPGDPFPRQLLALEVLNCDTSIIRVEPLPGGRNAEWPERFLLSAPPRYQRCAELMGFIITPGADVYPCAGGIGLPQLRLGNLETEDVETLLTRGASRADLLRLRREGPYPLYEACRKSPHFPMLPHAFINSCDFHRQMLSNEHLASIGWNAEETHPEAPATTSKGSYPWDAYISIR